MAGGARKHITDFPLWSEFLLNPSLQCLVCKSHSGKVSADLHM